MPCRSQSGAICIVGWHKSWLQWEKQKPIDYKAKKKQQVMDLRSGARRRFDLE
jgi:hypothetical protein